MPPDLVDHETLLRLLTYNKHTGVFTWNFSRGRLAKRGDIAGTVTPEGVVKIVIEGKPYQANRLAWFYVTGMWPPRLSWADDDPSNNRWDNIMEESERYSASFSARYQRERRAIIAENDFRDRDHENRAQLREEQREQQLHDDRAPRRNDRRRRPLEG